MAALPKALITSLFKSSVLKPGSYLLQRAIFFFLVCINTTFSTRPRNTWAEPAGGKRQQSPRLVPVFGLGSFVAWTFTVGLVGLVFFPQLETNSEIFHKTRSQRVNCAMRNRLPGWSFEFSELEPHHAPGRRQRRGHEGELGVMSCLV